METAKAWVALLALIVTSLLSSGLIVEGTAKNVLTIAAVILGAFLTWATPNKPKTIEGSVV